MRKFSLLLCILFLLGLLGCNSQQSSPETDPRLEPVCADGPADTIATEEAPAPTETEEPDIPIETVIETKYYTLTLPDSWGTTCFYSVIDETSVIIREAGSYEAFGGGKLCTLMMVPTNDETYKDFPNYELLCALDTPEGSFYVIALFPTDVQFNEDTMDAYNEMYDQLMDVLYTLQPVGDIEMALP